jgi:hypothetical protein
VTRRGSPRSFQLRSTALCLAVLCVGSPALVHADDNTTRSSDAASQARAFFEIGAQAYEQGDYQAALEAFEEAYTLAARPGLLFSMAQAHRRAFFASNDAQHLDGAIASFRKYLESGDATRRRDAEEALEQLVPLVSSAHSQGPAAATRSARARLMVASATPDAVLHVDGVRAPHLPYVATVAPGTHTLRLSAPGYRDQVRNLPLPEGAAFGVDIALEELPGTLALSSTGSGDVVLDGRRIGALPLSPLTLSAGVHQVSLLKPGQRVTTRRFTLERGGFTRVDLPLERSGQRTAAQVLLLTGGVGVIATAVLIGTTLDRQHDADELHQRLIKHPPISDSERHRYNHLVGVRNSLRRTTIGVGGSAAIFLIVGAALFWFDRPDPPPFSGEDLQRRPPSVPRRPSDVIAGPVWDGNQLGLVAAGRF